MKLLKHLKTKYNNLSLPVKVSFYFFACTIVQRGLSFLSTPIFTRLLSTSDFGKVSVYNSWREIIGIFSAFSLATSVSNVGLTEFHEDKDTFQFSLLRLGLLFTLVWIILFVFAYDIIGGFIEIEKKIAIIMLVEIYFSEIIAMWSLRERYEYRYKKMAFATLAASLLSVVNALILICVGFPGYYSRVVGSAFAYIFIGAICFYEIIRRSNHKINFKYWIFALKYNIPMIPHVLSTILLGQMDRIMIKDYCGVAKAGIYSVSYSCALIVQLLNTSFSVSYNPWLLQKIKRRDYDKIGE